MSYAILTLFILFFLFQIGALAKKKREMKNTHNFTLKWPLYLYIFTVMISLTITFALIYFVMSFSTPILIDSNQGTVMKDHNFAEMIYYSGSTLLSIGYGDLNPIGATRYISLFEGFLGIVTPTVIFINEVNKNFKDS